MKFILLFTIMLFQTSSLFAKLEKAKRQKKVLHKIYYNCTDRERSVKEQKNELGCGGTVAKGMRLFKLKKKFGFKCEEGEFSEVIAVRKACDESEEKGWVEIGRTENLKELFRYRRASAH